MSIVNKAFIKKDGYLIPISNSTESLINFAEKQVFTQNLHKRCNRFKSFDYDSCAFNRKLFLFDHDYMNIISGLTWKKKNSFSSERLSADSRFIAFNNINECLSYRKIVDDKVMTNLHINFNKDEEKDSLNFIKTISIKDNEIENRKNFINSINEVIHNNTCHKYDLLLEIFHKKEKYQSFIYLYRLLSEELKDSLSLLISEKFEYLLTNKKMKNKFLNMIKDLFPDNQLIKIIENSKENIINICFTKKYNSIIHLIDNIKNKSYIINKCLFSTIFNSNSVRNLFFNKYSQFILQHLLIAYKTIDFIYHLVKIIKMNFIYFSINDCSTFVIQRYLKEFIPHDNIILPLICNNFHILTQSRNGIFFIISILKIYKFERTITLLDIICECSYRLSISKYSSTLIEFCIKNYNYFVMKFINTQLHQFNNMIEDPNGNFIIQKLLIILDNKNKLELIIFLKRTIKKIKKISIFNKWNDILDFHYSKLNGNNTYNKYSSFVNSLEDDFLFDSCLNFNKRSKKSVFKTKERESFLNNDNNNQFNMINHITPTNLSSLNNNILFINNNNFQNFNTNYNNYSYPNITNINYNKQLFQFQFPSSSYSYYNGKK